MIHEHDEPTEQLPPQDTGTPVEAVEIAQPEGEPQSAPEGAAQPAVKHVEKPNPAVTIQFPVTRALKPGEEENFVPGGPYLRAVAVTRNDFQTLVSELPKLRIGNTEHNRTWAGDMGAASLVQVGEGTEFEDQLKDPNADWQQGLEFNGTLLYSGKPRHASGSQGRVLHGDQARQQLKARLGLGQPLQFPMYHSGLWLSFQAPLEEHLIDLEYRLGQNRISLGRDTAAALFSAAGVYHLMDITNFALSYVYEANIKDITLANLKRKLLITDIYLLSAGLAGLIHPQGSPLSRPCTNDLIGCQHIEREIVSIPRMTVVNRRKFTPKQLQHLSRRADKVTDADLESYIADHQYQKTRLIRLTDTVYAELEVPTVELFEKVGMSWVNNIVERADALLGKDGDNAERDQYMAMQASGQRARKYAHWVKRMILKNSEEINEGALTFDPENDFSIENREDIDVNLGDVAADPKSLAAYEEGVSKFIEDTTVAVVGIPRYNCPSCGADQGFDNAHPNIIAIDSARMFFTLLGLRIAKATIA